MWLQNRRRSSQAYNLHPRNQGLLTLLRKVSNPKMTRAGKPTYTVESFLCEYSNPEPSSLSEIRVPGSSAPPAPAKPAFSFAETMANLTKPKPAEPVSKSEENRPPETEEARAKRLRKEERRKLRVSFKPDDTLVQVRTFVHDPEEEMGHDSSMVRDVGDIGSEGRMLKMHKDLDIADDDEDREATEEDLAEWKMPTSKYVEIINIEESNNALVVDFSVIEVDELARNYETRGGNVEVKSYERAVQEQRELNTLMVIYTASSDIPTSPREPADPYSGENVEEQSFGDPNDVTKVMPIHMKFSMLLTNDRLEKLNI